MPVVYANGERFDTQVPLLIVGAGAAGLCAALAAKEAGVEAVLIERDAVPSGSTALSAGLIPAAGTRFQRDKAIVDSPDLFAADIQRKAYGESDQAIVDAVARGSGPLIEWLADGYGLPFDVVDNFNYPGHSALRMHGLPTRTGRELIDRLRSAAEAKGIVILTGRIAERLLVAAAGIEIAHGDGVRERIGCDGAYQGHGSVATPHNILITWAVIMQGGIQVNADGRRFCDESRGYSEQAADVLRQPGGLVWDVFDDRVAGVARQFEDFCNAERAGGIISAETVEDLAQAMHVPVPAFLAEWHEVESLKSRAGRDRFGRRFALDQKCSAPFRAVKVTGALFHTQGGLAIDTSARVRKKSGGVFANLFAVGGAAAGVSGSSADGYLSGNGHRWLTRPNSENPSSQARLGFVGRTRGRQMCPINNSESTLL